MLTLVRQIMRFCGSYARRIRIAWVFAFLKSLTANAPIAVAIVLVNGYLAGSLDVAGCVVAAVVMSVLLVLQSVFQYAADRLQSAAGYEIFAERRMELASHLRRLPMGYFSAGNMGKVSSVLSADMVYIEEQSMGILANVASDVAAQAIVVAFMFVLHPLLGAASLATVAVAVAVAQPMNQESLADSSRRQQSIEDLTSAVLEYTEGIGIIKSFNRSGEGARELREGFSQMTESNLAFERNHVPWERRLLVIYALGMSAVVALAVWLLGAGTIEVGSFIGVMLFVFSLFAPIKHMYQLDTQITITKSCLDRLQAVLDEPEIPDDGTATLPAPSVDVPEVELRDVTFGYGENDVLKGVSLSVYPGQTVALAGQSGSGKTTVANLISRFWDVSSGSVLVRGVDVRELPIEELMGALSMVFQQVYLFEDTVRNNICLGRSDATEEEMVEAAKKARCHDFIMRLPYGYDTVIGEGGSSLSGGEAQRVSIARCILKDAPIVILDEATANIDADNESAIQAAMSELCRDKTTVVIAHRMSTISSADHIVVLEHGRVAEAGAHDELLGAGGAYERMVRASEVTPGGGQDVVGEGSLP